EEILPEVGKRYKLTEDPECRAICGISSGGICAFTVAWQRPDAFRKVLSHVGSFTNILEYDLPGLLGAAGQQTCKLHRNHWGRDGEN
ncbi:MAG: alpha/beta hydrolase-fold protein, partial [Planctomycetota bacterium]|nr:alpha/beta hydrolase-fold protein [Planctomycetota bacterium]